MVAAGGQWWAVWREHVAPGGGPGDEFDQTELFQAYSIGGLHGRQRITNNQMWDSAPALARMPAGTFPLTLIWARGGSDFGAEPADLRGLRLGLVENTKFNSDTLLLKLAERLRERHGITVSQMSRKRSPSHEIEERAIAALKAQSDLVISGIGD